MTAAIARVVDEDSEDRCGAICSHPDRILVRISSKEDHPLLDFLDELEENKPLGSPMTSSHVVLALLEAAKTDAALRDTVLERATEIAQRNKDRANAARKRNVRRTMAEQAQRKLARREAG